MKNEFQLARLESKVSKFEEHARQKIYFQILDVIRTGTRRFHTDSLDEVSSWLTESEYYVANESTFIKDKKRIFSGQLVVASTPSVKDYLNFAIQCNDLRTLLIAPVFETAPTYAVYVHEDVQFIYYQGLIS